MGADTLFVATKFKDEGDNFLIELAAGNAESIITNNPRFAKCGITIYLKEGQKII